MEVTKYKTLLSQPDGALAPRPFLKDKESIGLNLDILESYINDKCGGKEVFLGCWSPQELDVNHEITGDDLQIEKGKNWFVVRNGAQKIDGLVFPKKNDGPELVTFRGYLGEAGIHSYSNGEDVRAYWANNLMREHVGVFSAAIVGRCGLTLSLVSDIFSVGPLYYRELGDMIFFSSSPSLLAQKGDKLDTNAWWMRINIGHCLDNTTLSQEIKKVSPATVMSFTAEGSTSKIWFDYSKFPHGEKDVDDNALVASHDSFSRAIERCERLNHGTVVVPLSSGYDSRRIFAHLKNRKGDTETCTVRMPNQNGEDIDGSYAPQMSEDFGIKNTKFYVDDAAGWHKDNSQRLFAVDAQTDYHTWAVPIFDNYKGKIISFFDGIGGDVFEFYGWNFKYNPETLNLDYRSRILNSNIMEEVKYSRYISELWHKKLPENINQDLLTFCIWQSSNQISLWNQQQAAPGHLLLCPYFDLDYIRTMLKYSSNKGEKISLQKDILNKFFPELGAYPGTGNLPKARKEIPIIKEKNRMRSLQKLTSMALKNKGCRAQLKSQLNLKARFLLFLSTFSLAFTDRISWWSTNIVEISLWWHSRPYVINWDHEQSDSKKIN